MQGPPKHGALGMTFVVMRAMQFVALVAIIGMTANFMSDIVGVDAVPPPVLIGTIVVVCIDPRSRKWESRS